MWELTSSLLFHNQPLPSLPIFLLFEISLEYTAQGCKILWDSKQKDNKKKKTKNKNAESRVPEEQNVKRFFPPSASYYKIRRKTVDVSEAVTLF